MATDDKSPVLRVQTGVDPNSVGAAAKPDFAFIQLGFQAVHNGAESEKQGRPVFDKALFVTHIYPGSTDQLDVEVKRFPADGGAPTISDPVRAARFADPIAMFEKRAASMEGGTPLALLNLDPAQIKNLDAAGAGTVEMLAAVPDSSLGGLGMGARAMRQRAIAYLEALNGGEGLAKLQSQLDAQAADNDELRTQLKELLAERKANAEASAKPAKGG